MATPMIASVLAGDVNNVDAAYQSIEETSPLGIAGEARDIANAALYLASDEAKQVTGHTLLVDAGVTTGASPSGLVATASGTLFEGGRRE